MTSGQTNGVVYRVDLYTHCGVLGIDIGGVWFAADPPLVEGAGNPPPSDAAPSARQGASETEVSFPWPF